MNCASCKEPIPQDAAFCPKCGTASAPPPPVAAPRKARTLSNLPTVAPIKEDRAPVINPGFRFADRYEVVRSIGQGGTGVAYLARDTNSGQELVLKLFRRELVPSDDAVKRLLAEGLTARQVRHPNVVAVHDVNQWNGQPYFTMDFVPGGTLRSWLVDRISSRKDVPLETAAGLMKSILAGLGEAHRVGVVHRDLKPENVLLSGDPDGGNFNLKILDFGIAKALAAPSTGGRKVGTPPYMAPEQETSSDAVGPGADLYSLSVMFYEMLMEAAPQSRWEAVSKNRPEVPPAIDELIEKGLSARSRSRQASADEYLAELDRAMSGSRPRPGPVPGPVPSPPRPPQPQPPHPSEPVRPSPWQNLWWANLPKKTQMWLGGAVAVVVIGVAAFLDGLSVAQFNATGRWRVNSTPSSLQIVHNSGGTFSGEGFMPELGNVAIDGTLSEAAGVMFDINDSVTDEPLGTDGRGQVVDGSNPGEKDIRFSFRGINGGQYSGIWHINH